MVHLHKACDAKGEFMKPARFYITISAINGETLLTSETLNSRANAFKNAAAVARSFDTTWNREYMDHTKNPDNPELMIAPLPKSKVA